MLAEKISSMKLTLLINLNEKWLQKIGLLTIHWFSSIGANAKSLFFYPKIKGALEEAVKKLNFKKLIYFQPPMLIRQPDLMRSGEKVVLNF